MSIDNFIRSLSSDNIFSEIYPDLKQYSTKSLPSLKELLQHLSAEHGLGSCGLPISYVLDAYLGHDSNYLNPRTYSEINTAINATFPQQELVHKHELQEYVRNLYRTTSILKFFYVDYLPYIKESFQACFLVGSMSYGRFYTIHKSSDLDLFLVLKNPNIAWENSLKHRDLSDFITTQEKTEPYDLSKQVINIKMNHETQGFTVSINITSENSFSRILDISARPEENFIEIVRDSSLKGRPNYLKNLLGEKYKEPYKEKFDGTNYILTLPIVSKDKPCLHLSGLTLMFLPRLELVYGDKCSYETVKTFKKSLCQHKFALEKQGYTINLAEMHPASSKLSKHMIHKFNTALERI